METNCDIAIGFTKNINYNVARKDLDVPFCKIAKFSLINKPLSFKKIPF